MTNRFDPKYERHLNDVCAIRDKCCDLASSAMNYGMKASIAKEKLAAAEGSAALYKAELDKVAAELVDAKSFQWRYKFVKDILIQDKTLTEAQVKELRAKAGTEATPVQARWLEKHQASLKELEKNAQKLLSKCASNVKIAKAEATRHHELLDAVQSGGGRARDDDGDDDDDDELPRKKAKKSVEIKWTNGAGKGGGKGGGGKGGGRGGGGAKDPFKPKKIVVAGPRQRYISTQKAEFAEAKARGDPTATNILSWAGARYDSLSPEEQQPFIDATEAEKKERGIVSKKKPAAAGAKRKPEAAAAEAAAPAKKGKGSDDEADSQDATESADVEPHPGTPGIKAPAVSRAKAGKASGKAPKGKGGQKAAQDDDDDDDDDAASDEDAASDDDAASDEDGTDAHEDTDDEEDAGKKKKQKSQKKAPKAKSKGNSDDEDDEGDVAPADDSEDDDK